MSKKRVGMPSKVKILEYWQEHCQELGSVNQGDDWGVEENECFACGNIFKGIERCHIIAVINGGTHDVSNLQLLCPSCHKESESLKNYFNWIRYKRWNEWHNHVYYFEKMCKINNVDLDKRVEEFLLDHIYSVENVKKFLDEIFKIIL